MPEAASQNPNDDPSSTKNLQVAMLGATGRTGRLVVAELLRRGHTVRVLVRDPAKLGSTAEQVQVVTGSSTDPAALAQLLTGADAVVSALGPTRREPDLHTKTAKALVAEMASQQVGRFVGISGAGVDVPGDHKGGKDKAISFLIRKLGGAVVRDKPQEFAVFAASEVDFTLVRPPRLVDGPATGDVYHDAHVPGRRSSISRADLAHFVVDVVDRGLYWRLAPFVSAA